jgi:hypothetical protein
MRTTLRSSRLLSASPIAVPENKLSSSPNRTVSPEYVRVSRAILVRFSRQLRFRSDDAAQSELIETILGHYALDPIKDRVSIDSGAVIP